MNAGLEHEGISAIPLQAAANQKTACLSLDFDSIENLQRDNHLIDPTSQRFPHSAPVTMPRCKCPARRIHYVRVKNGASL